MFLQLYIAVLLPVSVLADQVSPLTPLEFAESVKDPAIPPEAKRKDQMPMLEIILRFFLGAVSALIFCAAVCYSMYLLSSHFRQLVIRDSYKTNPVMGEWHAAAKACVEMSSGSRLGLGSGSVVECVIHVLESAYRSGELKDIMIVPSCHATRMLLRHTGLPCSYLESTPELDVYIDGPEEIDGNLNYIKDINDGDSLVFHKILQYSAKKICIIGDSERMSSSLGKKYDHVPIEVDPGAAKFLVREIPLKEGGTASIRVDKDDIDGHPMLTDNKHNVIDWVFDKMTEHNWSVTHLRLRGMPGVIDTGIFFNVTDKAYIAFPDGTVEEHEGKKT